MSDSLLTAYLWCLPVILALAVFAWALSVWRKSAAIVDIFWPLFLWLGASVAFIQSSQTPIQLLIFIVLSFWALRLSLFLFARNWNEEEDRRYAEIRDKYPSGYALISLPMIFIFQGVIAWLLGSVFFAVNTVDGPAGIYSVLGLVMISFGAIYETIADWQLASYKREKNPQKAFMDKGLWRFSRHPNYFGESVIWWGLFLAAIPSGQWWVVLPPLAMTWFLMKFSGVTRAEAGIESRRPGYEAYQLSTPALLPDLRRLARSMQRQS
ncbi:DUF1295 domain-containing protein [Spongiibacter sp. KMU-158]|uniref:DUF1295 domain-containing protein n=1 Tax=Spongiibacter pelagi TaxID=2760804 RepID=A0A927C485_9GAMM|nr:DUF1295 domain-containing protein [Spongiibacter pelagi]MBD2859461.1 DUF1295 domain-containing protein [Spongiibacter pelagi]